MAYILMAYIVMAYILTVYIVSGLIDLEELLAAFQVLGLPTSEREVLKVTAPP